MNQEIKPGSFVIRLSNFVENAYVHLVSGLILLFSSGIETVRTLDEGVIGAHHGVGIFAILQILKSIPHVLHGAEQISKIRLG